MKVDWAKRMNLWPFWMVGFCWLLSLYDFNSNVTFFNVWLVSPPRIALFLFSMLSLIVCVIGFRGASRWRLLRSLISLVMAVILSGLLAIATFLPWSEPIFTTHSPNGRYEVDFYMLDAGAATSIAYVGYLNGPLWFKKKIYNGSRKPVVKWKNKTTLSVNGRLINFENPSSHSS